MTSIPQPPSLFFVSYFPVMIPFCSTRCQPHTRCVNETLWQRPATYAAPDRC